MKCRLHAVRTCWKNTSTAFSPSYKPVGIFVFFAAVLAAILLFVFVACVAVQMLYAMLFIGMFRSRYTRPQAPVQERQPVSILICARNEARNLEQHLPVILSQRCSEVISDYEVVVVDDASTDDTAAVLLQLRALHPQLRIVTIDPHTPREFPGKKFALGKALDAALYDHLLLIDADCMPASEFWLEEMAAPLVQDREIVAGYGAYLPAAGLLNKFVRWETVHTFLQYSSYAAAGLPYMAVGRNLACTRRALDHARSSEVWGKVPSGDDDLLMRSSANAWNTAVVMRPHAFTFSAAKSSWAEWKAQKQRHLSTGKLYRPRIRRMLGLYALSHGLLWLLFIVLLFTPERGMAMMLMVLRSVLYWSIMVVTATRLREKGLWWWMPLCDAGWALYNFIFAPWILWKNKQQWT